MKRAANIGVLVAILLFSIVIFASQALAAPIPVMKLSEVKPGMKGIAKTVIKGTEISQFDIEVIDVIRIPDEYGRNPDAILIKASGDVIEQTGGVAAGMSGSPVFIDGKIIGAIAFGTEPFADTTIAGVTPIEQMLDVGPTSGDTSPTALAFNQQEESATLSPNLALYPLPLSLSCSGITQQRSLEKLKAQLSKHNLKLAPGTAKSAQQTPSLEPGSSIGVGLVTGDVSLGAIGTLTFLDGNKFWAFGHPFFYWGDVEFPLTGSVINTVVKSSFTPFKLGSLLDDTVGMVTADRSGAISGVLDKRPRMISVASSVTDDDRKRSLALNSEVVTDNRLLPSLGWVPFIETNDRVLDQIVRGTSRVKFSIEANGLSKSLVRENMFFSNDDVAFASIEELTQAIDLLLSNKFKDVKITKITPEASVTRERKTALIEELRVLGTKPAAGKVMRVEVTYRPWAGENRYSGPTSTVIADVNIPANFPSGPATVLVSGFTPEATGTPSTLEELIKRFEERRRNNEIVVRVIPGSGGATNGFDMAPGEPRPDMLPKIAELKLPPAAEGRARIDFVVEFPDKEISTSTAIGGAAGFTDVPAGSWAHKAISYLQSIGAANGYPDGTFHPNDNISRQELAVFLSRAAGLSLLNKPGKSFSDVDPASWSFCYINSAVEAGYLEGLSENLFGPRGTATRAQAIKSLVCFSGANPEAERMTEGEADKVLLRFKDAKTIPGWAKKYLAAAINKGLLTGYPDGTTKPSKPITRAEVAKLIALASGVHN